MARPIRRHGPHGPAPRSVGARLPRVELEITRGRARQRLRPIDGLAYLIGAADDNDLVLADPQFPDSHSYLLRSPLGLTLCWLGDGPDVTVNGDPVLSTALVPADARLRTGPYEFRVRLSWPIEEHRGEEEGGPLLAGPHDIVTADRGAGVVFETPVPLGFSFTEFDG